MSRSAERRRRRKGRAESGSFLALPHVLFESKAYRNMSAHAAKLLLDIAQQYRGTNNGDLAATWNLMRPLGWRSRDTLHKALRELLALGFIELTRQGGINRPSLYALTWRAIDPCQGKLDCPPANVASNAWRVWVEPAAQRMPARFTGQADTPSVPIRLRRLHD